MTKTKPRIQDILPLGLAASAIALFLFLNLTSGAHPIEIHSPSYNTTLMRALLLSSSAACIAAVFLAARSIGVLGFSTLRVLGVGASIGFLFWAFPNLIGVIEAIAMSLRS